MAARDALRFGLATMGGPDWPALRARAQAAEALGFDSLWLPDHPLMGWDSWTRLAALAGATERIRLGTMVTCVYYRNPVVLARIVADVDHISGGRAILGLGSGDIPSEFQQIGLDFPPPRQRAEVLEEALEVVPTLLRGDACESSGRAFQVRGAALKPPAVQQPYVPVLVAGGGEKTTLRLVAKYADASNLGAASWAGGAFTTDDVRRKFEILRSHCIDVGRPFDSILRTVQITFVLADTRQAAEAIRAQREADPAGKAALRFMEDMTKFCTPDEAIEELRALRRAGFEYFVCGIPGGIEAIERFARDVMRPLLQTPVDA